MLGREAAAGRSTTSGSTADGGRATTSPPPPPPPPPPEGSNGLAGVAEWFEWMDGGYSGSQDRIGDRGVEWSGGDHTTVARSLARCGGGGRKPVPDVFNQRGLCRPCHEMKGADDISDVAERTDGRTVGRSSLFTETVPKKRVKCGPQNCRLSHFLRQMTPELQYIIRYLLREVTTTHRGPRPRASRRGPVSLAPRSR